MSGKELRVPDYLGHMIEAIDRIELYVSGMDRDAFGASNLVVDAVIRNIEIIGEASNKVLKYDPEFVASHANVPWKFSYKMRSIVAHDYFKVDLDIVWATIKTDLPMMRQDVQALLDGFDPQNKPSVPRSRM
jgi:uncharacterized protein with HEPN domain